MKVEFVIGNVISNREFCGYERHSQEPKFRHVNFTNERAVFDTYPEAEAEVAKIIERYTGTEELRLQIHKHYIKCQ